MVEATIWFLTKCPDAPCLIDTLCSIRVYMNRGPAAIAHILTHSEVVIPRLNEVLMSGYADSHPTEESDILVSSALQILSVVAQSGACSCVYKYIPLWMGKHSLLSLLWSLLTKTHQKSDIRISVFRIVSHLIRVDHDTFAVSRFFSLCCLVFFLSSSCLPFFGPARLAVPYVLCVSPRMVCVWIGAGRDGLSVVHNDVAIV